MYVSIPTGKRDAVRRILEREDTDFVTVTGIIPPGTDVFATGQVAERLTPGVLSLGIAIGAGVAGGLHRSAGVSTVLVGIMIAVALRPPVAAIDVGIAWAVPELALGAGVFVLVNIPSINLAALGVFWLKGFRPEALHDKAGARRATAVRIGALVVGLVVLSLFLDELSRRGPKKRRSRSGS